jgi:hypothetical protein
MTNATKQPESVERANDLLLEHGHDMRNYGDWASMTNDERWNMIEERKTLLGKIGCNVSNERRTVINVVIGELRQVQDSLK